MMALLLIQPDLNRCTSYYKCITTCVPQFGFLKKGKTYLKCRTKCMVFTDWGQTKPVITLTKVKAAWIKRSDSLIWKAFGAKGDIVGWMTAEQALNTKQSADQHTAAN